MSPYSAAAVAHPNIAFIKYWGNRDEHLNLPSSGSLSMNLGALTTSTTVRFNPDGAQDRLVLNGVPQSGAARQRVSDFLDEVRRLAGIAWAAEVESENNFPMGAGIASSASGFAALSLAASTAAGLTLSEAGLSRLARRGSGSACRSIPGGFVEWFPGEDDRNSFAVSLASQDHWELIDCVAVVETAPKSTGSREGHTLADTSPLQEARLRGAPLRLAECRRAILERDFARFAQVVELDSTLMHAVMMTSNPPLFYWSEATLHLIKQVKTWRADGLQACTTIDAGANVHILCPADSADEVVRLLEKIPQIMQIIQSPPGGAAHLTSG